MIIKSISTLMYTAWHVDRYKITFKLVINSRSNPSRHVIIDARPRCRVAARQLRNPTPDKTSLTYTEFLQS